MVHGLSTSMAWLLLLVAQNTSKTLLLRWAVGTGKPHFLYSAAVLATEGLKASLSIAWVLRAGGSPSSIVRFLRTEWRIFLRVMVPAGIYNAQQMLEFVALSKLEAHVFSVIVQTKLLTTALFSYTVLGKQLRGIQLVALVLLMVGVILAQMKDCSGGGGGGGGRGGGTMLHDSSDTTVGVLATLGIATLSGFAAVYTERVLKHAPLARSHAMADVLPYMQVQMACASLLIIGVFAVVSDFTAIVERGLWQGFDSSARIAVVSSALGGLIVSAVLKYADSVLKGYATSAVPAFSRVTTIHSFHTSGTPTLCSRATRPPPPSSSPARSPPRSSTRPSACTSCSPSST